MSVRIVEFTDPYSIWCWGCEPALRRLAFLYPNTVRIEYQLGGLFEDFGPMRDYWMRMAGDFWLDAVATFFQTVEGQHRMPMNVEGMLRWVEDFRSTYPACLAVKAAEFQGPDAGARYLRRLREAALVEGQPIHRRPVQFQVAEEIGLDGSRLAAALDDGRAEEAFRRDLAETRASGVTGFPTFLLSSGARTLRIEGYRPVREFDEAVRFLDPDAQPRRVDPDPAGVAAFLDRYGRCATREIAVNAGA